VTGRAARGATGALLPELESVVVIARLDRAIQ
jgi:hypothetical protein